MQVRYLQRVSILIYVCTEFMPCYGLVLISIYITLHYSNLADALIQSDVHRSAYTEPGTSKIKDPREVQF